MPERSSSVVGREFGNGVRAIIARAGFTHRRLAELLGWQEAKISDMPSARTSVRKYISLRIVPRSAGMHAGTCGDFCLMEFPKYPPVAYADSVNYCLFFDDTETVKAHEDILTALAAVALSEEESRVVINNILAGLQ